MITRRRSKFRVRFATSQTDVHQAQRLRGLCFRRDGAPDQDRFDDLCKHVLVEDERSGDLVCCFRFLPLTNGSEISSSYSAQYYDLTSLPAYSGKMVEMGRFCIHPDKRDPDILRCAWGAMTRYVDDEGIDLLFGCSSFEGTDTRNYYDAFAMLRDRHIAPKRWLPRIKSSNIFEFARKLRRKPDRKRAMLTMPPLLRTYLVMGGWVSDHAVVDREMNTLHVFTGLEIGAIPPSRARLLRAVAS